MADTMKSLAKDERTARVMLTMGSEPGDSMTGRLLRKIGATATVDLATSARSVRGVDRAERELWQRRIASRLSAPLTRSILDDGERLGLGVLIRGDEAWPEALADLRDHAPFALWTKGDVTLLSASIQDRVALTGARAATGYGYHMATELAFGLVQGRRQIVSGGPYGIDAAAHRAALAGHAPTIAVVAGRLDSEDVLLGVIDDVVGDLEDLGGVALRQITASSMVGMSPKSSSAGFWCNFPAVLRR
ncbi:MAG: DNA-processing protein DprA [Candidatus Nanopelagicales bacterium]